MGLLCSQCLLIIATLISIHGIVGQESASSFSESNVKGSKRVQRSVTRNLTPLEHLKHVQQFSSNETTKGRGDAQSQIYPFLVAIMRVKNEETPSIVCAGSLIDRTTVLTAAHCDLYEEFKNGYRLQAWVGDNDLDTFKGQKLPIKSIANHPKYQGKVNGWKNDIGVVKLSKAAQFNDYVQPICLGARDYDKKEGILAGYGLQNCARASSRLQRVDAEVIEVGKCERLHGGTNLIRSQICGKFRDGASDEAGDSGSPLFAENLNGRRYTQIGLLSYSSKTEVPDGSNIFCMDPQIPTTFTRIGAFLSFVYTYAESARIC